MSKCVLIRGLLGQLSQGSVVHFMHIGMLLSQLSNVGVDGCRHLCCYLCSDDGENSVGDFIHYGIDFVNDGSVDGVVELVESIIGVCPEISNSPHEGLELVLGLSRSVIILWGGIIIVEVILAWKKSVLISRKSGATRVTTWDDRDSVDSSGMSRTALTGTVGHCRKAVGGSKILRDLIFDRTGRCSRSRGTIDGSCTVGRSSSSC